MLLAPSVRPSRARGRARAPRAYTPPQTAPRCGASLSGNGMDAVQTHAAIRSLGHARAAAPVGWIHPAGNLRPSDSGGESPSSPPPVRGASPSAAPAPPPRSNQTRETAVPRHLPLLSAPSRTLVGLAFGSQRWHFVTRARGDVAHRPLTAPINALERGRRDAPPPNFSAPVLASLSLPPPGYCPFACFLWPRLPATKPRGAKPGVRLGRQGRREGCAHRLFPRDRTRPPACSKFHHAAGRGDAAGERGPRPGRRGHAVHVASKAMAPRRPQGSTSAQTPHRNAHVANIAPLRRAAAR